MDPYNPSNPGNRKKTGSGFTNLSKIIGANQGNRLGQAVGGGVAQQANQARTGLNQARDQFADQAEKNRLDSEENKKAVDTGINRVQTLGETDDETVKKFETFRTGQYTGPRELNNEDKVVTQAQRAQKLGDLSTSSGGRQALLQRFVGDSGYSQGKQRLDNLLLGQTGASNLQDARRQTQGLSSEANQTADAAREKGRYFTNQARAFGDNVINRLDTGISQNYTEVDNLRDKIKAEEDKKSDLYKFIRENLAAGGERVGPQNLTDAKNTDLSKVNKALEVAQAAGIAQDGDTNLVTKMYKNLMTPAELLYRQKIKGEKGGYLGYGAGRANSDFVSTPGGNVYSNLGIDQVLNNAFTTKAFENLDSQGVATDLQRAKAAAFAKLAAKQSKFSDADKRFKGSSAAFDMNKAGSEVDAEIARLKGEAIKDLPERYEEIPLEKKLQRTFAPTHEELAIDTKQDINKLFSGDQSTGDKALAAAKLVYGTPFRAIAGSAVNDTKSIYENNRAAIDQMLNGNFVEGVASGAPLKTISSLTGNDAAALKQIPVIGNLLSKPVALASSGVGKAAKAAQSAATSTANFVKSIFCYGEGTPIKMSNGSYKNVEKLELGDEVYYGGKVTATGKALEDDIYDYLGCLVTGSHAVFEDGKFVRVQDSNFAKKVPGKKEIEVFPIETENHILVTKTHLGSDFSEIDEGHTVSPEERLEKLNSDKSRLKKLDTASVLIFKDKDED